MGIIIVIWGITLFDHNIIFKNKDNIKEIVDLNKNITTLNIDNNTDGYINNSEERTIIIYKRMSPAVVNITSYKTEYVRYFFDVYPQTSEGQGSGAIIDPKGYVVTNYHVVGEADKVTVSLSQEEDIYEAKIIGVDPENDVAVIKINNISKTLTSISMGSSKNLRIGQNVYAIGNPFGLDRTLTTGIISGLGRPIKAQNGNVIEGATQTDASINPGNSGGPLLDSSGKMIGMNTMIISPSGGSVGLGFAIPVDTVKDVVDELIKYGYVKRGWIDATFFPITPSIAKELDYSVNYGVMVMGVAKNGEAYNAGLRGGNKKALYRNNIIYIGGEIITSIDGVKIKDYSSLVQILKNKKPGETIAVEYYKENKKLNTTIKLIDKRKFVK